MRTKATTNRMTFIEMWTCVCSCLCGCVRRASMEIICFMRSCTAPSCHRESKSSTHTQPKQIKMRRWARRKIEKCIYTIHSNNINSHRNSEKESGNNFLFALPFIGVPIFFCHLHSSLLYEARVTIKNILTACGKTLNAGTIPFSENVI